MAIDIDERKVAQNEFGMWLGWVLATAAGMLLGFLPAALFISDVSLGLARVVIPLLAGFLVGFFQWLVLRSFVTNSRDWILAGGAGWAFGYALGLIVIQALSRSVLGAVAGYALFGIIVALVQYPVLRREVPNIVPWVIANLIGWAAGSLISQAALNAVFAGRDISLPLSAAVIAGLTGLVAGAVTGLALVWIVRKPERGDYDYIPEARKRS